jgi:hypothetical protein
MTTEAKLLQKICLCVASNVAFPIKSLYRTSVAVQLVSLTDKINGRYRVQKSIREGMLRTLLTRLDKSPTAKCPKVNKNMTISQNTQWVHMSLKWSCTPRHMWSYIRRIHFYHKKRNKQVGHILQPLFIYINRMMDNAQKHNNCNNCR